MDVKKIRFLTELKIGPHTWRKGSVLEGPFSASIQSEIRAVLSGKQWPATLEVIERMGSTSPPVVQKEPELLAPEEVSEEAPEQVEDVKVEDVKIETPIVKEEDPVSGEDLSTDKETNEKPKKVVKRKPPLRK